MRSNVSREVSFHRVSKVHCIVQHFSFRFLSPPSLSASFLRTIQACALERLIPGSRYLPSPKLQVPLIFFPTDFTDSRRWMEVAPTMASAHASTATSAPAVTLNLPLAATSPSTAVFPFVGPNPEALVYSLEVPRIISLPSLLRMVPLAKRGSSSFSIPPVRLATLADGGVHDLFRHFRPRDAGSCVHQAAELLIRIFS